uniref:Uncharacterized protein n=1 Tax=mine drainage metagenome TaxID=410659 RepID=E6QP01_9ZZZZ
MVAIAFQGDRTVNDRIRGVLAVVVGIFAMYEGYKLYQVHPNQWQTWVELAIGPVLIALGVWRFRRNPKSKLDELLK